MSISDARSTMYQPEYLSSLLGSIRLNRCCRSDRHGCCFFLSWNASFRLSIHAKHQVCPFRRYQSFRIEKLFKISRPYDFLVLPPPYQPPISRCYKQRPRLRSHRVLHHFRWPQPFQLPFPLHPRSPLLSQPHLLLSNASGPRATRLLPPLMSWMFISR